MKNDNSNSISNKGDESDLNILGNNDKSYWSNSSNPNSSVFYPILAGVASSSYHLINELSTKKTQNKIYLIGSSLFVFGFAYGFTKIAIRNIENI